MTGLFWKGLALGFLVAAPVGPVGLLCLSRTLAGGWSRGFVSGLGAATADAFYAGLAGLGVALVSRLLSGHAACFSLAGALWLGWLGVSTLRTPPRTDTASPPAGRPASLPAAYFSILALTVTNPLTILFFTAAYASPFGLAGVRIFHPFVLAAGAFSGSGLWWLFLSGAAAALRTRLSATVLRRLNTASGLAILGFALAVLIRAFR